MIQFSWHTFTELSVAQLYAAIALREQAFVLEQKCAYVDADGKDPQAHHLLGIENGELVAYARLFTPQGEEDALVFGRVVTAKSARNKGYGKKLIQALLTYCDTHFPGISLKCSAQLYLKHFYQSFGFKTTSEPYNTDGIPHIAMRRDPQ